MVVVRPGCVIGDAFYAAPLPGHFVLTGKPREVFDSGTFVDGVALPIAGGTCDGPEVAGRCDRESGPVGLLLSGEEQGLVGVGVDGGAEVADVDGLDVGESVAALAVEVLSILCPELRTGAEEWLDHLNIF